MCTAHMPQESERLEVRESAFGSLNSNARRFSRKGEVVILGDLNARPGDPTTKREKIQIGRHGEPGKRTGNGKLMVNILNCNAMISLLGQSRPPDALGLSYWYTRYDRPNHVKHTIDHVLVTEELAKCNPRAIVDYTHLPTDHHAIIVTLPCPRHITRLRKKKMIKKVYRFEKLIQRSANEEDVRDATVHRHQYEDCLVKALDGFEPQSVHDEMVARGQKNCDCLEDCTCEVVKDFIERHNQALEQSVGSKIICRKFSRKWYDEEVRELVKQRREAYAKLKEQHYTNNSEDWNTFKQLRRKCKKIIRRKKREHWDQFLEQLETAYKDDHKMLWTMIRKLIPSSDRVAIEPMITQNGELADSEEQIVEAWRAHQQALGTPSTDPNWDTEFADRISEESKALASRQENGPLDADFSTQEVARAIQKLDYHKAAAEDGTRNPTYKCGGDPMVEALTSLFNHLKEVESCPADWSKSIVVNLYKDGSRTDPSNYRGIALISCLGKLYLSLWARRITAYVEPKLSECQGGFRPRRSTTDQALTLREILVRRKRLNKPTYLYFVDFKKAFDTVWHDGLWVRLERMGVKGKCVRIIRSLYSKISSKVRVGDKLTSEVKMFQGVRQGCPLSPVLFNIFVNELAERLCKTGLGVPAADKTICSLFYADDVVILAKCPLDLQKMISVVDKFCDEWRMKLNLNKSKVMIVNAPPKKLKSRRRWFSRGKRIEIVNKYKYLGIWFNNILSWSDHFKYIISKAKQKSQLLRNFITKRQVTPRAKLLVWLAFVRPLLDYGCEIWEPNSKVKQQIESIQTKAGALIFKVNEKSNRQGIRALMKCTSLENRRHAFRLKYLVKLLTFEHNTLMRHCLEQLPAIHTSARNMPAHWIKQQREFINQHHQLGATYNNMIHYLKLFGGVLPSRPATIPGTEYEVDPVSYFRHDVTKWMWELEKKQLLDSGTRTRSTLRVLATSLSEVDWPHIVPITRRRCTGVNQIRLRLLVGTSALNETLAHYNDREPECPFCATETESPAHFLLQCQRYKIQREKYQQAIKSKTLQKDNNTFSCHPFFKQLKPTEKVAFMLGGPVKGVSINRETDRLAEQYILEAYEIRSGHLESVKVIDRTGSKMNQTHIQDFFVRIRSGSTPNQIARHTQHNLETDTNIDNNGTHHGHTNARSPNCGRYGTNGPMAMESD